MRAHVLFASSILALGLVTGCDDRKTGSTEPQASPAGGRITGSDTNTRTPMNDGTSTQGGITQPGQGSQSSGSYSSPTTAPSGSSTGGGAYDR